jgi:uncharacterized phage-associated protein
MVTAHDVAAYILTKQGEITTMKLEKLVYYSQAWSLVWDERPLFNERIEAWIGGPIIPALYDEHRKQFMIAAWPWGNAEALDEDARDTVDAVLKFYGTMSGQELSDLTHAERPWQDAREGLAPNERGHAEITQGALYEFYESLPHPSAAVAA